MQKTEALPFLIVEEALKRSKVTQRFQEELALSLWERARVELVYIRNLQEWMGCVDSKLKPILDKIKDPSNEVLLSNLVKEGMCTLNIHQNIHNQMMMPGGAYKSLQRGIGLNTIGRDSGERVLSDIEKQYSRINKRRLDLETEIQKQKLGIEKMKTTIIQLEEQHAKRSRVANAHRSSKGHRKVDQITNRLSMLRKQVESERGLVENKEDTQVTYMKQSKEALQDVYQELTSLQKVRFELIYSQVKTFAKTFKLFNEGSKQRRATIQDMVTGIESIDTDEVIERTKNEVEANANKRKNGHIFELQDIFSPMKSRAQAKKKEYFSATTLPNGDKPKISAANSAMGNMHSLYSADNSDSDNVLVDTFCASSSAGSFKENGRNPCQSLSSDSSDSSFGSNFETIIIPSEPVCMSRMPPPFPTKEFCVSSGDEEDEGTCSYLDGPADLDSPCSPNKHHGGLLEDEVNMMRNVKVVSAHNYVSSKKDVLSLKKGQVIKQKVGENEEGFCYGWIRENRLAPKQYGWYPAGIVELYAASPSSENRSRRH